MTTMQDDELAYLSVAEQGALIQRRELSPVELTATYLRRIERYDDVLRSYITVAADHALQRARQAEQEIAAGGYRGPLHGIVYGVKDQLRTRGVRTTLAWNGMREHVPDHDAAVIASLDDAGAVLVGKHNLDQFGKGGTADWHFGRARNPWDARYGPSGSSGGSGVATAAGLCSAALGEDTGGSVRLPGAVNGVVGLRPTFGRVSRYGGFMYGWTADTIGPLARTTEDAAILLRTIAGHDPRDPLTTRRVVPDYPSLLGGGIAGLRVGVISNLIESDVVDPEVRAAFDASVEVLADLGAEVGETTLPLASYSVPLLMLTSDSDVAATISRKWLRSHYEEIDVAIRTRMAAACLLPATAYSTAMRGRALVRAEVFDRLRRFDLLVCPTGPRPPGQVDVPRTEVRSKDDIGEAVVKERMFTYPFSLANTPAISIPNGFTSGGLPVGLQLVGRPFAEADLFRAAHAYERATPWHRQHPDLDATIRRFEPA